MNIWFNCTNELMINNLVNQTEVGSDVTQFCKWDCLSGPKDFSDKSCFWENLKVHSKVLYKVLGYIVFWQIHLAVIQVYTHYRAWPPCKACPDADLQPLMCWFYKESLTIKPHIVPRPNQTAHKIYTLRQMCLMSFLVVFWSNLSSYKVSGYKSISPHRL